MIDSTARIAAILVKKLLLRPPSLVPRHLRHVLHQLASNHP